MKEAFLAQSTSAANDALAKVSSSSTIVSQPETPLVNPPTTSTSTNAEFDLLKLAEDVEKDYRECFPEICKFTETFSMQTKIIEDHLRKLGWTYVKNYTFIQGSRTDQTPHKDFSLLRTVSEHIPSLRLPQEQHRHDVQRALNTMWLCISRSMEQDVPAFSMFVKRLPGYNKLPMDDRLIMFKSVLIEQFSLGKANTYQYEINAHVFYDQNTEDIHLLPMDVMKVVFADDEYHAVNER